MAYDKVSGAVFFSQVGLERPGNNIYALRGSGMKRLAQLGVPILNDEAGVATREEPGEELL